MHCERVGIAGAGTMGAGIAIMLLQAGREVVLVDRNAQALERAVQSAVAFLARAVEKARVSRTDADAALARLETSGEIAAFRDCDLVIEAVFEDADVKKSLIAALSPILRDDAILATNTSALTVSELAPSFRRPDRFLGLHFFNPAQTNPIVEIVRGRDTDPAVVQAAEAFCREVGKTPIACVDSHGFALNRFFCPFLNEAVRLLDEMPGAAASIEAVARHDFDLSAGPFQVINLVKPRILLNAQRNLAPHGAFYSPAQTLLSRGDTDYGFDGFAGMAFEDVPPHDRDRISDRLQGAVFLPVLELLQEGVASARDVDLGARLALRFGKPPCARMDGLGATEVARLVEPLCARHGAGVPASAARIGLLLAD